MNVVIDTNVFVAALLSDSGAEREIVRRCLSKRYQPAMSLALFAEYRDVMAREALFAGCVLNAGQRHALLVAFMSVCRKTEIYYLWRPNLRDEADNHVIELAIAAGAKAIVTHNVKDFSQAQMRFPSLRICAPAELLKEDV